MNTENKVYFSVFKTSFSLPLRGSKLRAASRREAYRRYRSLGMWGGAWTMPRRRRSLITQELKEYKIVCKVVKVAALIFNLEYHYECFHSQS
ncbi:hypothetical protein [Anabaena sp. CCY 9910]|uniref:hypothetical protein n=1 Tax=Anabaena sp. CCY 9910 TaxID=3103870 RepID=UPI0039E1D36E